ncbi:MAG: DUF6744 family protein [Thermoguttaceae bacterium]|jgi:hypothetical protein
MIEREYDISGAIVFWSLQPTPYQAVREVFTEMGYADCVPNPRTDQSALENSIRAVYGTRNKTIISRKQPKRNGVELVNIERSTQRNGYITNFGARVLGSRVKADYGFADEGALTEEFLKLKARLTTTAVGQALVAVLEKMDGMTGLKPGVYYIPEHHLKRWKELAERVEGCQEGNKITTARVAMDEGTARTIRDTLTQEVQEKAAKLLDDVSKGTLNDTQLQSRAKEAQALVDRVTLYSSILNEGLEGLKSVAQLASGAAAAAVMQDFAAGIGMCA